MNQPAISLNSVFSAHELLTTSPEAWAFQSHRESGWVWAAEMLCRVSHIGLDDWVFIC